MFPLTHSLVRASSIRGAFSNYHQGGRLLIIGGGGGGRRIQTSSDRGGLIESTPRNVWVLVVPGGVVKNWRFHASNVRTPPLPPVVINEWSLGIVKFGSIIAWTMIPDDQVIEA